MNEDQLIAEARHLSNWQKHRFMVLVAIAIAISLVLVTISLWLYNTSGAAQLDLSREAYKDVRSQAGRRGDFTEFPSSGVIDKKALDQFRKLYDVQLKEATAVESFGGDVLSDAVLGLDAPVAE